MSNDLFSAGCFYRYRAKKMRRQVIAQLILLWCTSQFAMGANIVRDSLVVQSYDQLISGYENPNASPLTATSFLNAWIRKAKSEHDYKQLAAAYESLWHDIPDKDKLVYCDSILWAASKSGDNRTLGSAYVKRGIMYYKRMEYDNALRDYLIADAYIVKTSDEYLQYKVQFTIAQIKYYLGFYEEAASIFKDSRDYFFSTGDTIPYLRSSHGLAMCLNRTGRYADAAVLTKSGLSYAYQVEDHNIIPYFLQADGVALFGLKQYDKALTQFKMSLPAVKDAADFANEALILLYMGKCIWEQGDQATAVRYFEKVDAIFLEHQYTNPILRDAYVHLINFYEDQRDFAIALHYSKRLEVVHANYLTNYKHLYGKISGEYNPRHLKQNVAELEQRLFREQLMNRTAIPLLCAMCFLLWLWRRKKNLRKPDESVHDEKEKAASIVAGLKPEVVKSVLAELEAFEKRKDFLKKNLSTLQLSKMLNSNARYVQAIVSHFKGVSPPSYINDLRIQHALMLLEQEKYRNYSIKALASEAGFGTAQHFAKEFRNRTKVLPSEYLERFGVKKEA